MNSAALTVVALGSNQGDRHAHLAYALHRLAETFGPLTRSPIFETDPFGVAVPQPAFLNMVVTLTTDLSAGQVLEQLLAIEHERGRARPFPNAPRTLDLDLILHGDTVLSLPHLTVPHPRFRERAFVLEPLAAIAPDLRDPVTGAAVAALWRALRDGGR